MLRQVAHVEWLQACYQDGLTGTTQELVDMHMRTVSLDQGADGWAGCQFMLYNLMINLVVVPDPYHRVWNDVKSATRRSGLMHLCVAWCTRDQL